MLKNVILIFLCMILVCTFSTKSMAACSNNEDGNPGQAGEIEYFSGTNLLRYCNDTNWITMCDAVDGCAATGTACSNTGEFYFNTTDQNYEWCDGTNIWTMGPVQSGTGTQCKSTYKSKNMNYESDNIYYYCGLPEVVPVGVACSSCGGDGSAKVAFVQRTSSTTKGDKGGLTGADAQCQADATYGGLSGTYMAWLADSTGTPDSRFSADIKGGAFEIVMPNGVKIADDWADLTDGTIDAALNQTVYGAQKISSITGIFTNVTAAGLLNSATNDCDDWTSLSSADAGQRGVQSNTTSTWTEQTGGFSSYGCHQRIAIYCFEQ